MPSEPQDVPPHRPPSGGVTLIELLVALAVVALLSALAWPGYSAVVLRAQRNEARFALLRLQHLQERHYATYLRYADSLDAGAGAGALAMPDRTDGGHYQLSVSASPDGQGYTAMAVARAEGGQARDRHCLRLAVDHTGLRRSADAAGNWSQTDSHRCWS